MRLVTRLASLWPTDTSKGIPPHLRQLLPAIRHIRRDRMFDVNVPVIVADNVAQYYAESPNQFVVPDDGSGHIQGCAPPFNTCWVEYVEPALWRVAEDGGKVREVHLDMQPQNACFVEVMTGEREVGARDFMRTRAGHPVTVDWATRAKWVLAVRLFSYAPELSQNPYAMPLTQLVLLDDAGDFRAGMSIHHDPDRAGYDAEQAHGVVKSASDVVLLTFAYMACKNVAVVDDAGGSGQSDKWHRRTKTPVMRFKKIMVGVGLDAGRAGAGNAGGGGGMPYHICRGSFATYKEDAPLFGKYVGRFWRPAHVKGNAKHGQVVHEYNVADANIDRQ